MQRPHTAGLTLLELAIAIAVMAVLSTLAWPGIGARMERQRLQSTAERLSGDITEARFEAARRGQPLYVQADAGTPWCWAVATTPACACGKAETPACRVHAEQASAHRGVRLEDAGSVRMDPNGAAQSATPAVATLTASRGERLRVEVSPLGRSRVCAPAGISHKAWPSMPVC